MSIWSTSTIRGIECGYLCKECGEIIGDDCEGEERMCEDCDKEFDRKFDEYKMTRILEDRNNGTTENNKKD